MTLPELFGLIKDGGPYALALIFAFLYWREHQDRKTAEQRERETWQSQVKDREALLERIITAMEQTKGALATLSALFTRGER